MYWASSLIKSSTLLVLALHWCIYFALALESYSLSAPIQKDDASLGKRSVYVWIINAEFWMDGS